MSAPGSLEQWHAISASWRPLRAVPAARRPPAQLRRLLDSLRRTVRSHELWQPGATVLVACSGGRDSMALLALLRLLEPSLGHTTCVGHVDHGLQPDSAAWAAALTAWCAAEQIPLEVESLGLQPGAQLEARAREGRYAALAAMAARCGAAVIATAHHADDQAETLLMRASRGAAPAALAGARRRNGSVVRPLLGVGQAALHAAIAPLGLPWLEDPSNAEPIASRNRLRHQVLPALNTVIPGATAGLARTATLAAEQAGSAEDWMLQALRERVVRGPNWLEVTLPAVSAVARGTFWHWAASQLEAPAPGERAVQQLEALHSLVNGEAQVAGLLVQKKADVWHFVASDIARARGAD